jgi:hypothetical protein
MRPGARRAGISLVELLVVLVLSGVLLGSALGLLSSLMRGVDRATVRWDRMEAARTVWVTVEREVRAGRPGRDWRIGSDGVLALRAFRGFARVCGSPSETGAHPAAWRGDRLPVPDRDSLLVLGADGGWRAGALTRWSEGEVGCTPEPGEREGWMEWTGGDPVPPVLVRGFEPGGYSFHQGAFRYARGGGPRQPLTPEIFGPESRFLGGGGGVAAELDWDPLGGSPGEGALEEIRWHVGGSG